MNLVEQLAGDLIIAMKKRDKDTLSVLRMIKGAMQLEHINNKRDMDTDMALEVISKQIKTRNESIKEFEKASRSDLIDQTRKEIVILETYLPPQLTKEEIVQLLNIIFQTVNPTGPSDMGKIMKEITPLVKGKADMSIVSTLIKERLQK